MWSLYHQVKVILSIMFWEVTIDIVKSGLKTSLARTESIENYYIMSVPQRSGRVLPAVEVSLFTGWKISWTVSLCGFVSWKPWLDRWDLLLGWNQDRSPFHSCFNADSERTFRPSKGFILTWGPVFARKFWFLWWQWCLTAHIATMSRLLLSNFLQ